MSRVAVSAQHVTLLQFYPPYSDLEELRDYASTADHRYWERRAELRFEGHSNEFDMATESESGTPPVELYSDEPRGTATPAGSGTPPISEHFDKEGTHEHPISNFANHTNVGPPLIPAVLMKSPTVLNVPTVTPPAMAEN